MMAHTFNYIIWEIEAGGPLSEFEASQGYKERSCAPTPQPPTPTPHPALSQGKSNNHKNLVNEKLKTNNNN